MVDAGDLPFEIFSGRVGEAFRLIPGPDAELPLTLAEAEPVGEAPAPNMRTPFSLIFSGPPEPILPQAIYPLEHAQLGELELFLVPLQPDASGARYQAVFN